jgi:hypothetical protein
MNYQPALLDQFLDWKDARLNPGFGATILPALIIAPTAVPEGGMKPNRESGVNAVR